MTPAQRWCIVEDDTGDAYLCPAERRDEAVAILEAIGAYWDEGDYAKDPPGLAPDYLVKIEGGMLTFESPLVDGEAP